MLSSKLRNESGMAMIVAMMVTLIGTLLASSYMGAVIHESRTASAQKQRTQLLFLAEAGIEQALYLLNNRDDPENPWVDEYGELLGTPLYYTGYLADGRYEITLYDHNQIILPLDQYLVESTGIITKPNGEEMSYTLWCIIGSLDGLLVPAALSILDDTDPEDEISKFQSNAWTVDGRDHGFDGDLLAELAGLPGIAVANDGDDVGHQLDKHPELPHRLDQVKGALQDEDGNYYEVDSLAAIIEDPDLPKNLDAYANYFRKIAIDVSDEFGGYSDIPEYLMGSPDDYQVLYADLSQGDKKIAGNATGYGVLVLEGYGEFEMAGNSTWNGIIICAGDSYISLKGGGNTPAHINGALLIANGIVEMNGNADVKYSSATVNEVNNTLLLYQVYAWCGDWGIPLGEEILAAAGGEDN